METSSKKKTDVLYSVKFFRNVNKTLTEIKPTNWDEGGMIWRVYTEVESQPNSGDASGSYLGFFVGTKKDFKEYGIKMEKRVGPIPFD
ncbi:MAG: hypothetical protein WKF90_13905 [Pyrinomonadaceae bacterium]